MGRDACPHDLRWLVAFVFLGLLGCKQEPAGRGASSSPGTGYAPPPASGAAGNPTATAQLLAPGSSDRRAGLPTPQEWNAVKGEVIVKGSSALGCETKMLRAWLRISCPVDKNHGPSAAGVSITKGGEQGSALTFRDSGHMGLVLRFERGTSLEALFVWPNERHRLHAAWPAGERTAPRVKAVFEGVASPLDAPAAKKGASCRNKQDCGPRMECCFATGPGGGPACFERCAENSMVVCGTSDDCGAGWRCINVGYDFDICAP